MVEEKERLKAEKDVWSQFQSNWKLTGSQLGLFKKYTDLLIEWNQKINLTRITKLEDIISLHFEDSLMLGKLVDLDKTRVITDVGTGGGFPGLPLKIKFPHLKVNLIEVTQKKLRFLETVIKELELKDVNLIDQDWLTFLRQPKKQVDIFLARASLKVPELLKIFGPKSAYKTSRLVYWASEKWKPTKAEEKLIKKEFDYVVEKRKRKLILF